MGGDVAEVTATSAVRAAETLLRLLPLVLCLVALVLVLKDSQTTDVYGSLSYSNIGAFRYLVHACGICAGYSLISAVAVAVVLPRSYTMYAAWLLFLLDQFVTYIVLAAGATSMEVAYLAYKGDTDAAWSQACTALGGFCTKAVAATAITFVTTLCYAALSLISSYRLFARFDAPLAKDIHTASIQLS